jgi:hypothetical protein
MRHCFVHVPDRREDKNGQVCCQTFMGLTLLAFPKNSFFGNATGWGGKFSKPRFRIAEGSCDPTAALAGWWARGPRSCLLARLRALPACRQKSLAELTILRMQSVVSYTLQIKVSLRQ